MTRQGLAWLKPPVYVLLLAIGCSDGRPVAPAEPRASADVTALATPGCMKVSGSFSEQVVTDDGTPCREPGFRCRGTVRGGALAGDYSFVYLATTAAGINSMDFLSRLQFMELKGGTLFTTDAIVQIFATPGPFTPFEGTGTALRQVTGGTGAWAGAYGLLRATIDEGGGTGQFSGQVCRA